MKKYIFGSLILAAGMLASCSLDETPKSSFSEEEAMQSETLIYVNTVAAVYNSLGNRQATDMMDASNFVGDEYIVAGRLGDWVDGGTPQNKVTHNILPSQGGQADWSPLYTTISQANSAIAKLEGYKDKVAAAENYIYELRAYRAFLYYHLCDFYGNVPLVTSAEQTMADTQQSSRPEVFKFIVNELNECMPHLSGDQSQKSGTYFGRMTKPVAYMVLAKMAINASIFQLDPSQANWSKDYMGSDMTGEESVSEAKATEITGKIKAVQMTIDGKSMNALEAVVYCVDKLENDFGYKLAPSYAENFIPNNENSVENIFTIPNDAVTYKRGWDHHRRSWHYNHAGHPAYKGFSGWNGAAASTFLVKKYGYTEDRQESGYDPRLKYNFYLDRDYVDETGERVLDGYNNSINPATDELALEYMPLWSRLDMSSSEDIIKGKQAAAKYYSHATPDEFFQHVVKSAGARYRKYTFDYATTDAGTPGNDLVVFRFADAKLLRAEAKYRLGQAADALAEINDVRARVGLDALTEINMQVISDERLKELAWEGSRRQDMIRYAIMNQPNCDRYEGVPVNSSASKYVKLDGHTYVWPIPADQMSLNTNLKQNWGY